MCPLLSLAVAVAAVVVVLVGVVVVAPFLLLLLFCENALDLGAHARDKKESCATLVQNRRFLQHIGSLFEQNVLHGIREYLGGFLPVWMLNNAIWFFSIFVCFFQASIMLEPRNHRK